MKYETSQLLQKAPLLVGVVASRQDAEQALKYLDHMDMVELRLDCINTSDIREVCDIVRSCGKPFIITARDSSEGGNRQDWTIPVRALWYRTYMSTAAFIDIEVRTAQGLAPVIAEAKVQGVGVILSTHHWGPRMPPPQYFKNMALAAEKLGGDILKFAIETNSYSDLLYLAVTVYDLPNPPQNIRIKTAAMGMGEQWGKFSRLLFGLSGTTLVYGHLGNPNVKGQGHIAELRELLDEFKS